MMQPDFLHPYAVTGFITSVVTACIGLFVFLNRPGSPVHRAFLWFSLAITVWSFFTAFGASFYDEESSLFWTKFCHVGASFIPVFFYYFALKLAGRPATQLLKWGFAAAGALSVMFAATDWAFSGVLYDVGTPSYPHAAPFYAALVIFFIFFVLYTNAFLYAEYRKSQGARKKHMLYFLIASVAGFFMGIINFFPVYGIAFFPFPYSAACGAIYSFVIAYAIIRHRLFDIELFIKKTLVFTVLFSIIYLLVSSVIVLLSFLIAGRYPNLLSGISIILAMAIYEPLKSFLTRVTERFLFQSKKDYAKLLAELTGRISAIRNPQTLGRETVNFLTRELGLVRAAIYRKRQDILQLEAASGSEEATRTFDNKPLVDLIQKTGDLVVLSPFDFDAAILPEEKENLRAQKIEAIAPLFIEGRFDGILLLGRKKSDDPFSGDDEILLHALIDQVSMLYLSCRLLEEATHSNLALGQRMKMTAIAQLSRGVHHEVRNPLHAISLFSNSTLENFEQDRYAGLPLPALTQKIEERAAIMLTEIDRIKNSLSRFAQFARPDENAGSDVLPLRTEVDKFLMLMREGRRLDHLEVRAKIAGNVFIRAGKRALQEILFNLFNNAYEAMKGRGTLRIEAQAESDRVTLRFCDSGGGIPEEILPKIFQEYFTTKTDSEAIGIGLTIVKHHLESIGGGIEAQSDASGTGMIVQFKRGFPEGVLK